MLAPQQTSVLPNENLCREGAAANLLYFRILPTYVCQRIWEQAQPNQGAGTTESRSRDDRIWEQRRPNLGRCSPKGIGTGARAMFFRLSALFSASGHQRHLAARTEKRRCKTRMGCATPLFIKGQFSSALLRKWFPGRSMCSAMEIKPSRGLRKNRHACQLQSFHLR